MEMDYSGGERFLFVEPQQVCIDWVSVFSPVMSQSVRLCRRKADAKVFTVHSSQDSGFFLFFCCCFVPPVVCVSAADAAADSSESGGPVRGNGLMLCGRLKITTPCFIASVLESSVQALSARCSGAKSASSLSFSAAAAAFSE